MVEQNARRCLQICDRGYVLDQGRDAYTGTGRELANDPKVIAALLGHVGPGRRGRVAPELRLSECQSWPTTRRMPPGLRPGASSLLRCRSDDQPLTPSTESMSFGAFWSSLNVVDSDERRRRVVVLVRADRCRTDPGTRISSPSASRSAHSANVAHSVPPDAPDTAARFSWTVRRLVRAALDRGEGGRGRWRRRTQRAYE